MEYYALKVYIETGDKSMVIMHDHKVSPERQYN